MSIGWSRQVHALSDCSSPSDTFVNNFKKLKVKFEFSLLKMKCNFRLELKMLRILSNHFLQYLLAKAKYIYLVDIFDECRMKLSGGGSIRVFEIDISKRKDLKKLNYTVIDNESHQKIIQYDLIKKFLRFN